MICPHVCFCPISFNKNGLEQRHVQQNAPGKQKQKQRWKLRLRKIEIEHKNRVKEEHRCVHYEGQTIVTAEIRI